MQSKTVALMLGVVCVLFLSGGTALATPTPPYVFVNDSTRQCIIRIHGDDCSWCEPPEGWRALGVSGPNQCPADYTLIENLKFNCERYKNQFCCTSGAHHGNCEDMVVNDTHKLCAFVEDIAGCALPEGWRSRPGDVAEFSWICPYGYQWDDAITCLAVTAPPEPTATKLPDAGTPAQTDGLCSLPLVAVGALVSMAWFAARRTS